MLAGQLCAVAGPWPLLIAAACGWLLRAGRSWLVASTVLGIVAWLCAAHALGAYDQAYTRARDALGAPARCELSGTVESSPVFRGGSFSFDLRASDASCDHGSIARGTRVRLMSDARSLARGDRLDVVAGLAPVERLRNPGSSDPGPARARRGVMLSGGALDVRVVDRGHSIASVIDRARAHVRERILAVYPPGAEALGRALVLGEEDLSPDEDEAWKKSGLSHLLAVSGSHLAVVVLTSVGALAALLGRHRGLRSATDPARWAAFLGVPLAFVYADFAGKSGSALRAALMLAVVLAARALGRRPDVARALGLSLLLAATRDALAVFDVSLLLSALATLGLLVVAGPLATWLRGKLPWVPNAVTTTAAATVGASVGCAPVLLCLGATLPIGGLVANMVAGPIGELFALPAALASAACGFVPALERGTATLAGGALLGVSFVAHEVASLPYTALPLPPPTTAQLAIVAVASAAFAARRLDRRVLVCAAVAGWVLAEGWAICAGAPQGRLRVTFLDVGQGDAALVDLPDGSAMLIDGGGQVGSPLDLGKSVVTPTLRSRRRRRIDVVVLSHPHPDHFLGLASTLPSFDVGELWDTGQGESEGAGETYEKMLHRVRARGTRVRRPEELCGRHLFGGATVDVLAPCPSITPFANANDNSLVLKVSLGARSVLFVGDAEREEENALIERGAALHADVLKVGHHGSRTSSSPAFLARVSPTWAVISSGVRNRFGHPHPIAMGALGRAGVQILRTDRGGAVVWETDGDDQRIAR